MSTQNHITSRPQFPAPRFPASTENHTARVSRECQSKLKTIPAAQVNALTCAAERRIGFDGLTKSILAEPDTPTVSLRPYHKGLSLGEPAKWTLIGLGGTYDPTLNAMLGEEALRQLDCFTVTKAFVSAFCVDATAATTNSERQVGIIRKALDAAQRRYLLVDRTKFNRTGVYRLSSRGAFDAIVTVT